MAGPFYTAWSTDFDTSVRVQPAQANVGGYVDLGNLSNATDSNPYQIGETANYVAAIGGYGFNDLASGSNTAQTTQVYAGIRRATRQEDVPGAGCRAYLYTNGFTPSPTALYPEGVSVPGALSISPKTWVTLGDDTLAITDGSFLYIGVPGIATRRTPVTSSGFSTVYPRAMAFLVDGTIVIASQAVRTGDSQACVLVSTPVDYAATLPGSVDLASTVYEYDAVNPWKACLAGLGAAHGADVVKAQSHKFVIPSGVNAWSSLLAYEVTPSDARLVCMNNNMFNASFGSTSPVRDLFDDPLTYSLAGDVLTYAHAPTSFVFAGDATISAFDNDLVFCRSVYADSNQYTPPDIPLFWQNKVRCNEAP